MTRIITVSALYPDAPDDLFNGALHLGELQNAMSKIATYDGLPDREIVQGDEFMVDVTLWKVLKTKGHVMRVETLDREKRLLQSREHNPQVKRWDHTLTIQPDPEGAMWTDRIVFDAGWQTPIAAQFCRYVYKQRHVLRQALFIETSITRAGPVDLAV